MHDLFTGKVAVIGLGYIGLGQAATTLFQAWSPPRERGVTWSTVDAVWSQWENWQRRASRTSTARRESAT